MYTFLSHFKVSWAEVLRASLFAVCLKVFVDICKRQCHRHIFIVEVPSNVDLALSSVNEELNSAAPAPHRLCVSLPSSIKGKKCPALSFMSPPPDLGSLRHWQHAAFLSYQGMNPMRQNQSTESTACTPTVVYLPHHSTYHTTACTPTVMYLPHHSALGRKKTLLFHMRCLAFIISL